MSGASREFHLNGFRIFGVPAKNFGDAGEISDKEIEKAKEQDTTSEEGNKKVPARRRKEPGVDTGSPIDTLKAMDKHLPS